MLSCSSLIFTNDFTGSNETLILIEVTLHHSLSGLCDKNKQNMLTTPQDSMCDCYKVAIFYTTTNTF